MRIGKVVAPGPVTKLASTRSSSESAKASIHPDATAGQISGSVTVRNVRSGGAARARAAEGCSLQSHDEAGEPRLHHHGDEAQRQRGMRDDDGPEPAVDRGRDE